MVELRHLRGGDLDQLLEEETRPGARRWTGIFAGRPTWSGGSWKYRLSTAMRC